jgi:hypothetical protein
MSAVLPVSASGRPALVLGKSSAPRKKSGGLSSFGKYREIIIAVFTE